MLLGPNMGSGTTSAIGSIEAQVRYLVSALTTMRKQKWHSIDVREAVQREWNVEVQRALGTSVYDPGRCASNYIDRNGVNSTIWPWTTVRMNRRIKEFVPAEYQAEAVRDGRDSAAVG
jgi:cyclohexanone monooxygenase